MSSRSAPMPMILASMAAIAYEGAALWSLVLAGLETTYFLAALGIGFTISLLPLYGLIRSEKATYGFAVLTVIGIASSVSFFDLTHFSIACVQALALGLAFGALHASKSNPGAVRTYWCLASEQPAVSEKERKGGVLRVGRGKPRASLFRRVIAFILNFIGP